MKDMSKKLGYLKSIMFTIFKWVSFLIVKKRFQVPEGGEGPRTLEVSCR